MTGGGFGGFAIALADADRERAIRSEVPIPQVIDLNGDRLPDLLRQGPVTQPGRELAVGDGLATRDLAEQPPDALLELVPLGRGRKVVQVADVVVVMVVFVGFPLASKNSTVPAGASMSLV